MPSKIRFVALLVLAALIAGPVVVAQPPAAPTDADLKVLREKFQAERDQAVKAKFPADTLAKADALAKRAEEAAKSENYKAALRHIREARWQLPYLPVGLPANVTRVLGESRMRHADRVNGLSYSPDGVYVASASKDYTVKVWDLGNGRESVTYRGHVDQPGDDTRGGTNVFGATDVAFHPTEKIIASASGNQVHTWEPATGKQLKTLVNLGKTDKPIRSIAYSPNGKLLAIGADDGIIRVVEADSGKAVYTSPSRGARIERVVFSPNSKLLAIGDSNMQVAVYVPESKNNALAMSVQGVDVGEVYAVGFTSDNASVFTGGRDGKIRLTAGPDAMGNSVGNTATLLRNFTGHDKAVTALSVTADGKFLVSCGEDKTVRVWDIATSKQLRSFQGHIAKTTAVTVRGDGRQIASASEDGAVRVWDLNTNDEHRVMNDSKDSLWAVAISPDGKRVASAGADKKIRVYELETGKPETTLEASSPITSLVFLNDSNRLVAAGGTKSASVWDVNAKKVSKEMPAHALAVLALAASDDSKQIVSGAADATVRGSDPESGKELWKWGSRKAACALSVRKGGKHVAVGVADGNLVVIDVSTNTPKEIFAQAAHVAGTTCVAYSPDGNRLASVGGDGSIRVWTVEENGSLSQLVKFDGQAAPGGSTGFAPLSTVVFSPDGRFIAAAGADSTVRVWDVQSKSEVRSLRGHTDWVTSVAFSPDSRFIASVSAEKDNTLRVFELPPLESTSSAGGHLLAVNAVAISPNGKYVATAAIDQTIKIWEIASGKEVATLIGNSDTPFAIAFATNENVVMGGRVQVGASGRLHFWGTTPPRLTTSVATGEVYTVVAAGDGSKVTAWASRQAVGAVKNNVYETYDAKGKLLSSTPDTGRNVRSATFTLDLAWAVAGDENGVLRIFDLEKK